MRCPKCQYISFGSAERCRNCGYEFVLSEHADAPDTQLDTQPGPLDLPVRSVDDAGPFADFNLAGRSAASHTVLASESPASPAAAAKRPITTSRFDLPLFGGGRDDAPLVTPPAVPRVPLSVRRSQPAVARARAEPALPIDDPETLVVPRRAAGAVVRMGAQADATAVAALAPASVLARVAAGAIDLGVLGAIDGAVLYSTLRLLGLSIDGLAVLPLAPLGVFLLLLNGGYFAIFTTEGGQTIGKMLARIRVIAVQSPEAIDADGLRSRVTMGASVLRASAYLVSLLPAGLGFLAILFDSERRALHDRLAETRVVKA